MLRSRVADAGYYRYLDGLRGAAILLVLVVHVSQSAQIGGGTYGSLAGRYFGSGQSGVELFFILSAFTLFASSRRRFATERAPVRNFYVRRAFRILPAYWIALTIWAVALHERLPVIAAGATFAFGFIRFKGGYDAVPGGWSLFVEETFYLLLPFIFLRLRTLRHALLLLVSLLMLSVGWDHLSFRIPILRHNYFWAIAPPELWFAFGFGIVAYFVVTATPVGAFLSGASRWLYLLDGLAALALAVLAIRGVRLTTFALFLLTLASVSASSFFGRLARTGFMVRMGRYCYSIYLTHFLLLYFAAGTIARVFKATGLDHHSVELRFMALYPVVALVSLALAFITFNAIERPCIDVGRAVIRRLEADAAAAAGAAPEAAASAGTG